MNLMQLSIKKRIIGFSFIELLIVMAIMGILASIAIPSYRSYLVKSRRTEAITALLSASARMQKYKVINFSFQGAKIEDISSKRVPQNINQIQTYQLSLSSSIDSYQITATATNDQKTALVSEQLIIRSDGSKAWILNGKIKDCWPSILKMCS